MVGTQKDGIIDVSGLYAGYGDKVIVHDVSFSVQRGEILALIGGSGCGKSTIIRTLVGLLAPTAGRLRIFGEDPNTLEDDDRIRFLRRIGMLFQNGALLGSLTVGENVILPLKEHTKLPNEIMHQIAEAKLAMVGLPQVASLMPNELSGGMRKRAALSRAMAMDPELLLCDEPSAGLDPIVASGIDETLLDLRDKLSMTLLVVTHDLASVKRIADRVVMLDKGHVLAQGTVSELEQSTHTIVRDFFSRQAPTLDTTHLTKTLLDVLEEPT